MGRKTRTAGREVKQEGQEENGKKNFVAGQEKDQGRGAQEKFEKEKIGPEGPYWAGLSSGAGGGGTAFRALDPGRLKRIG